MNYSIFFFLYESVDKVFVVLGTAFYLFTVHTQHYPCFFVFSFLDFYQTVALNLSQPAFYH